MGKFVIRKQNSKVTKQTNKFLLIPNIFLSFKVCLEIIRIHTVVTNFLKLSKGQR